MTGDEIRNNFNRVTRRSFFRLETVPVEEVDMVTQVERTTRRQRVSRIIAGTTPDGRTYLLYKRRNPNLA
jgi:hypothetical protein